MRKVYICSPYRAKDGAELDRNIDYAQELTRQALHANLAPITPHLYMTQCLDESKTEERTEGLTAGLALLKICDFIIVGVKYGISEGMRREIAAADAAGIEVVNADKLKYKLRNDKEVRQRIAVIEATEYAKQNSCYFCRGSHLHSCTGYDCRAPYKAAYDYAMQQRTNE